MQSYDDFYDVLLLADGEREKLNSWMSLMKKKASDENLDVGDIQVSIVFSCLGGTEIQVKANSIPETYENPCVVRAALDW